MTSSSPLTSQIESDSGPHIEWNVHYDATCSIYTHPRHLAALALMTGHHPPPIEEARILELGCATGGNLTPIAMSLPKSECVGIDPFAAQIKTARQRAHQAQVDNVTYLPIGVSDLDQLEGKFDYIIAHGLFSWVSDEHREDTLKLCRALLSPKGIAYISYNTYPHWHLEQVTRSLLRWQHEHLKRSLSELSSDQFIRESRGLLSAFTRYTDVKRGSPIHNVYQDSDDRLKRLPDWYIVHEYLLENNRAFYFEEWIRMLSEYDLAYLGDAASNTELSISMIPQALLNELKRIHNDKISVHQGIDFLINRSLRRSIICHGSQRQDDSAPISTQPWTTQTLNDSEIFDQLFVASPYMPKGDLEHLSQVVMFNDVTTFKEKTFSSRNAAQTALLLLVGSVWPRQVSLRSLMDQAQALLTEYGLWGSGAQTQLCHALHVLLYLDIIFHPTWGRMLPPTPVKRSIHSLPQFLPLIESLVDQWPQSFTNYHHNPSFPSKALHWLISNYTERYDRAQWDELLQESPLAHTSIDDLFAEAEQLGLLSSSE